MAADEITYKRSGETYVGRNNGRTVVWHPESPEHEVRLRSGWGIFDRDEIEKLKKDLKRSEQEIRNLRGAK